MVEKLVAPFQRKLRLNNIDKSLRHFKRAKKTILSSKRIFAIHFHLPIDSLKTLAKWTKWRSKDELPDTKGIYRSYSTASNLVPNMRYKAQILNLVYDNHYINHDMSKKQIRKFRECGKGLIFAIGKDLNLNRKNRRHHHLIGGFFCDFKYCPIRQAINAHKRVNKIFTILKYLYSKHNWLPIFITLTIKNVTKPTAHKIRKDFKAMNKSWNKMSKYTRYDGDTRYIKTHKGLLKGWVSKPEHTYNSKKNTINLHLHVVGIVRKSYLMNLGSKYFVPKKQWKKDWFRALPKYLRDNSPKNQVLSVEEPYYKDKQNNKIKISDIIKAHGNINKGFLKCAKEISKYTGKAVNYGKMPKIYGKNSKKKIDKWCQDNFNCKPNWHNKSYVIRQYLLSHLSQAQLNAINAFHAIYKGLRGMKVLRFGGRCQQANEKYKAGALKEYQDIPKVLYQYKISSNFDFNYKDYLDTKLTFSKEDIRELAKQGLDVKPIDIKTGEILENKKSATQIMKDTPNSLVRKWFKENITDKIKWWKNIVNKASTEMFAKSNARASL